MVEPIPETFLWSGRCAGGPGQQHPILRPTFASKLPSTASPKSSCIHVFASKTAKTAVHLFCLWTTYVWSTWCHLGLLVPIICLNRTPSVWKFSSSRVFTTRKTLKLHLQLAHSAVDLGNMVHSDSVSLAPLGVGWMSVRVGGCEDHSDGFLCQMSPANPG